MTSPAPNDRPATETHRTRLLLVVPSMGGGGAERLVATLVAHLDPSRFDLEVALLNAIGPFMKEIPQEVPVFDLKRRGKASFPILVVRLARLFRKRRPDAVICFMWGANTIAILARLFTRKRPRIILSEHIATTVMWRKGRDPLWRLKRMMIAGLYGRSDKIIAVSEGVRDDLLANYPIDRELLVVIPPPVDLQLERAMAARATGHPWFEEATPVFLAAGRLSEQKDYPTLLQAFARLSPRGRARLIILGSGDIEAELQALARELGVADQVDFAGYSDNPFAFMSRAAALVLSSRYEGFGMVLVEAMALGTPVITTDCPVGPAEVVEFGESGLLCAVGDHIALADHMERVISDEPLRTRLIEQGNRRAQDFEAGKIAREYEDLVISLSL